MYSAIAAAVDAPAKAVQTLERALELAARGEMAYDVALGQVRPFRVGLAAVGKVGGGGAILCSGRAAVAATGGYPLTVIVLSAAAAA
jgi:hypothetical protein